MSNFKGIYAVIYKNFTYIPISLPSDFLLELIFFPLIWLNERTNSFLKLASICAFSLIFSHSLFLCPVVCPFFTSY